MTVGSICNREIITIQRDATVLDAAKLMRKYHVGDVVVIEYQGDLVKPVGIVTDRDIVIELIATELNCSVITTGDIMLTKLVVINESVGIFEAIQTMATKGVRRLPIIDDDGGLVGIVTLDDLLLLLAKELGSLTKLISREMKNEITKRR